ncbi:L,D-transpeptidase [Nocardia huaxiensis]|uniref:L,D-transpeptidase n=1 Tax=Nocardia huaxiensis TaxID=2755382 RepID=A0A7D6ZTJ3_9NOCA|nr:Ig-like domain-containing protein [Nocardia huaxiensis]QLY33525.1 L,D-transpeptidase [Nocardia huaxiensis]UFS99557.1 Ig-like domain-containing protein [Nocardia huaxiensis]
MSSSSRCHRSLVAAVVFAVLTLLAAACSGSGSGGKEAAAESISFEPAQGAQNVDPTAAIQVEISSGALTTVIMTNEEGRSIEGVFTPDRTTWKPNGPLGYGRSYTVQAEGVSDDGPTGVITSTFTTLTPSNQTKAYLTTTGGQPLADGGTYGIGTVVVAHFDEDIPDRAAAEKRLSVTTDPAVEGSWYWLDARNVHWRPQAYYQPGTRVTVTANIYGAQLGPGLFGQEDSATTFTIGPAHIAVADDRTHRIEVFENGNLVRTMPTSMGQGGSETIGGTTISFWTQPGVYTVMDKANPVIMDSSTYGLPINSRLGYRETISWATRISTDGVYLHALDATLWAQGNTNVSHGCLNLSTDHASWFYNFALPGDVVEIRNTGGEPLQVWQNGDWGLPWDQWLEGSAVR